MTPGVKRQNQDIPVVSRRDFFGHSAAGLGGVALAWLLHQDAVRAGESAAHAPHFAPKAKRIVQIFCPGGVSHVDTFDYKPDLAKFNGQELSGKGKIDTFFGQPGRLLKSPFAFAQHGQCGQWVSDLLPNIAECVDDLTFLQAMVAKSSNHTPAAFQMNTGFTMNGFPCMGAWVSYGLGTENQDLPAFVVLPDPRGLPAGGSINWTAGFLPAEDQGVAFRTTGDPIPDLFPAKDAPAAGRKAGADLLTRMNKDFLDANPGDSALSARVRSYELAARMQMSIPESLNLAKETEATKKLYGLDAPVTEGFGRNCLLARRLLERGVRFVQLIHGGAFGSPRINWDAHEDIVDNHTKQAAILDRPVAGLLKDLKARGLLDDTLVLWTTEFGRTPFTQGVGAKGRDHHPLVFTCWMAGAGLKKGFRYGASDEVGYLPAEDATSIYDFHATVLHLLGLDHKKLTFYHNGIQRRLTDVHGEVIDKILV
ncbi:MAG TPA: DUF1501 domain-containing protein [Planctomycetales bacterium]|jgi:hypothetical protein|nr:DUF1501 domain-containing protein [Planctomycetales bacterium]